MSTGTTTSPVNAVQGNASTAQATEGKQTSNRNLIIGMALFTVYVVWGTTYLAIRFGEASFPPFMLMGIRFLIAGGGLFAVLRMRGAPMPTMKQWRSAIIVGALLLGGGMGFVALAETSISSGLAATLVATSPLLAMLFSLGWGHRPRRVEWLGVVLGLIGVGILSFEGNLQANPGSVVIVLIAAACWSLGSVWSNHLDMPHGAMGNAAEMICGGVILCGMALLTGEKMTAAPTPSALLALAYLVVFGSLGAISAYMFLLKAVPPALATSYAFVNPVIALLLGVVLGGEHLTGSALIALPVIIVSLLFVILRKQKDESPLPFSD